MSAPTGARAAIAAARSVVVKLGTAVLTGGSGGLDRAFLHDFASEIAAARRDGRRILVVSSGAVGAGVGALGLGERPTGVAELQAVAAVGQPRLMDAWREALSVRGASVAQVLLSRSDFDSRERFLNIRNCVGALHEMGVVPIVNENDTVATEELSLGDNDMLAAKLAVAVRAEALVIMTTAPGVLDALDQVVPEADSAASLSALVRPDRTRQGRGGMRTKVEAARIAGESGIPTVIAPGRSPSSLSRILRGDSVGTAVGGGPPRLSGRRLWIALSATPSGDVVLDDGAVAALRSRGASLLARGVREVRGRFGVGDVVRLIDHAENEVARGLTNLTSDELGAVRGRASAEFEAILGRRVNDEVIHRDHLALTEEGR